MKEKDQDFKVIDITNYNTKKRTEYIHEDQIKFIRYKREIAKTKQRISFLYSIINFLLLFNVFLTLAIFYLAVLR